MKKIRNLFFFLIVFEIFLLDVAALPNESSSKRILLIAGHGLGKDCNHAYTTINGISYFENKEARILVDKIAEELKKAGYSYEIANKIVGDAFWSSDSTLRNAARNCASPNTSNCCGYYTSTIGTYGPTLMNHIDTVGNGNYSLALEVHFNGGGGKYSLVMGRDYTTKENGLKIANSVVSAISFGEPLFGVDKEFYGGNLGTLSNLYQARSIPTYYLETVFMDNTSQFQAYLNHKDEVAKSIAETLIEIAPNSKGGYVDNKTTKGSTTGRYVDPYPNIFKDVDLSIYDDVGCDTLFFNEFGEETELKELLDDLFSFIRILTPVVVILLTTIDYVKAIASGDDSKIKKATKNTSIRLAVGICIFFLPYFLDLLFHLFGLYDLSRCGIGGK